MLAAQRFKCAMCGVAQAELKRRRPRESLELHHIDGNPRNNKRSNFRAYCSDCHHIVEEHKKAAA